MHEGRKECPRCSEIVVADTFKCEHCGELLGGDASSKASLMGTHGPLQPPATRRTGLWIVGAFLVVGLPVLVAIIVGGGGSANDDDDRLKDDSNLNVIWGEKREQEKNEGGKKAEQRSERKEERKAERWKPALEAPTGSHHDSTNVKDLHRADEIRRSGLRAAAAGDYEAAMELFMRAKELGGGDPEDLDRLIEECRRKLAETESM